VQNRDRYELGAWTGPGSAALNSLYFHGGEMPGYNSFMGYDPVNDVTLIIWTSLTVSLDGQPPANAIMLKMLDRIYDMPPPRQGQ
jgi:D-alanyl-D-alanine carboxypeptidase